MTTYEALTTTYRQHVSGLTASLRAQLMDSGMTDDEATSALDRTWEKSTGKSATLWGLLADVPDPAQALPLSLALCVFCALKGAAIAMQPWTAQEPPRLPSEADLARLLEQAWRTEQPGR